MFHAQPFNSFSCTYFKESTLGAEHAFFKNCSLRTNENIFASLSFAIFREKNFAFALLRNLIFGALIEGEQKNCSSSKNLLLKQKLEKNKI
jgi:hypothetical protein